VLTGSAVTSWTIQYLRLEVDLVLKDKVILVTGASKGIGRALAVGLAADGASVAISFKTDELGAEKTRRIIEQQGRTVLAIQADLAERDQAMEMIEQVVRHFGRIDTLVNNAARTRFGPFEEVTEDDWLDVVNTNLKGTFFASTAAVRHMRKSGRGAIVNVSSCAASLMVPFHSVYTMSKGGIEALTRQLAVELAPEVRVNCISPAPTSTERNQQYDPHYDENWGRVIPMRRVAQPEDMVGAVSFLASDRASYITGQVLQVDGGWTLKGHTPDLQQEDFSSDRQRG
jgi:NAD(P)-dependent dehydrogenase (short-subunit alcohol dehydrogenase family)